MPSACRPGRRPSPHLDTSSPNGTPSEIRRLAATVSYIRRGGFTPFRAAGPHGGRNRALTGPPAPLGRGLIRRDRRPPEHPKLAR